MMGWVGLGGAVQGRLTVMNFAGSIRSQGPKGE